MGIVNNTCDDVISLFSGAGGFSYGFAQAGVKPICGAELNQYACNTYEDNVGGICHNIDLSIADPCFFSEKLSNKQPFAVIGGPPCQGFSTAGSRNSKDPRNKLIFNYLKIVKELNPRWFIFENVEGLLTSDKGIAISSLVREFISIGYSIRVQKVNFAAYGVPQTRKRVLIIGNNLGLDFEFPRESFSYDSGKSKKISEKQFSPTLLEAISGLGSITNAQSVRGNYSSLIPDNWYDELMRVGNEGKAVLDHFSTTKPQDIERFKLLAPGQTMKDLPEELWHESFRKRAFRRVKDGVPTEKRGGSPSGIKRLHGNLQSLTITGSANREFIHPIEDRTLTIRECARLQSFPDQYKFSGKTADVMQQIGNAVPPMVAKIFAEHLKNIDGKFGSDVQVISNKIKPSLLGFHLTESQGKSEALQNTEFLLNKIRVG